MSGPQDARGPKAVAKFLRPRSVAIIGMSTRAGSAGQIVLQCLKVNKFAGDIHLVGRTDEPIDGRLGAEKYRTNYREGIDLAVFTLPAAGGARGDRGVCAAQGRLRHGVRRGLCRSRRSRHAGRCHDHGASLPACRCRAELPWRYQQCRRHDVAHAVCAPRRYAAFTDGVAFVGQARPGGPLPARQRRPRHSLSYVVSTGNEAGLESTDSSNSSSRILRPA